MPAALSKPVLTERFGALNLPIGGTHGYVGVHTCKGSKSSSEGLATFVRSAAFDRCGIDPHPYREIKLGSGKKAP